MAMIKASKPDRKSHQMAIRVHPDLLAALLADAGANERTLAQTVRFHLSKAVLPQR